MAISTQPIASAKDSDVVQQPVGVPMQIYPWDGGAITYSTSGTGPLVLLVHGIYAGASSFEFRRTFPLLAQHFQIIAPNLPGSGLSRMPLTRYNPETYVRFLTDFTRHIRQETGQQVILTASSLTCAFALHAQHQQPDLWKKLVLIEPAGIERLAKKPTAIQRSIGSLFRSERSGPALYSALVSRPSLRYYLQGQVYLRKSEVTPQLIDAYYAIGHQPGARYAAASFVGGDLNLNIADDVAVISAPTLLCWGNRAKFSPLREAEGFVKRNPSFQLHTFANSGSLPQDEAAPEFADTVTAWLKQE